MIPVRQLLASLILLATCTTTLAQTASEGESPIVDPGAIVGRTEMTCPWNERLEIGVISTKEDLSDATLLDNVIYADIQFLYYGLGETTLTLKLVNAEGELIDEGRWENVRLFLLEYENGKSARFMVDGPKQYSGLRAVPNLKSGKYWLHIGVQKL
ncbi:MAG: hypothetical protein IJ710_03070 [Prevotella sp.]|nr:hypothetical protein [Prevotella sp.]